MQTGEAIPPRLADLVMRCLKKKPEERPQSMEEVIAALDRIIPTGNTGAFAPAVPAPARRRGGWIALAALVLATAGVGVWRFVPRPTPSAPERTAPSAPAPTVIAAHPAEPAPKPAPEPPKRVAPAPPVEPTQVTLAVTSTPPGAEVRRVDTGEVLGVTPVELKISPVDRVALRLVKSGFEPSNREVRLSEDVRVNVILRHANVPAPHEPKRRPHGPAKPVDRDAQLDPFANP